MATLSKLSKAEKAAYARRATLATERYGVTAADYFELCMAEHKLGQWYEEECNGTIERDETTGRPYRYGVNPHTGQRSQCGQLIPDRETGAIRRAQAIVAGLDGVTLHLESDPRGCCLYLYRPADLYPGQSIDSACSTMAHACYF